MIRQFVNMYTCICLTKNITNESTIIVRAELAKQFVKLNCETLGDQRNHNTIDFIVF